MGEAVTTEGSSTAERVAALRAELAARGVGGFIVPRSDEYQGEYVPPCAERLAWITGFTGSAGTAVILKDRAAIFVDGRYTLQARDQVDGSVFEVVHSADKSAATWIAEALPAESRLGYDPWLHTKREAEHFRAACGKASGALVAMDTNPIDAVWSDRPAPPAAPVVPHPEAYAGRSAADKRMEIAERLAKDGADAVVLTMPDSIAWLLNIRGGDVGHTPLPLSFAILDRDGRVALFMDERKVTSGLAEHLGNAVSIVPPAEFDAALRTLGTDGKTVQIDPSGSADHVFQVLGSSGAKTREAADPCALPKAVKNAVEIEGTRHAHRRDGAALTRFLHWLSATAPQGGVTEIAAADRLEAFRREDGLFRDLSFPTISGAGSNGAIVHYRVTDSSNRPLQPGELYLVDSGAQYPDGTTDVTRTVAIGAPSAEMRDRFTRVLKGHIAIATARFPRGTNGGQLDTLARLGIPREKLVETRVHPQVSAELLLAPSIPLHGSQFSQPLVDFVRAYMATKRHPNQDPRTSTSDLLEYCHSRLLALCLAPRIDTRTNEHASSQPPSGHDRAASLQRTSASNAQGTPGIAMSVSLMPTK